jgi:hypothetical protein
MIGGSRMSILVLSSILSQMHIQLSRRETEELYYDLLMYFGLIGGVNECQALEYAWRDPRNRKMIEEFIIAWLNKKKKKEILARYI